MLLIVSFSARGKCTLFNGNLRLKRVRDSAILMRLKITEIQKHCANVVVEENIYYSNRYFIREHWDKYSTFILYKAGAFVHLATTPHT